MSADQVMAAIPHRAPFLWVDEILEQTGESIRTRTRVAPEEPFFKGHYPDFPITPGVLVLEAIFQAGAILLSDRAKKSAGKVPVMTKISDARFKTMVRPGDVLEIEVKLEDALEPLFHLSGRASVNGKLAASTKFACALAPKPE
jgi:3-hydroxyacyl-[acyl-carrier-protein] dehydratase